MLTQEYRPKTFSEIEGQILPKKIMKSIVENPKEAPRSIILHGNFGTGKSSMAKVFARALNCESSGPEPCMECETCREDIESTPYYREYDAAVMGGKNELENIKNELDYSISNGWRVINLEEIQSSTKSAQAVLLRTLEEITSNTFVVFCTTELDKILDTIRSRSLEVEFKGVDESYIKNNLIRICKDKGKRVEESTLELISVKSRGSVRDAQMDVDELFLIGEEEFNDMFYDSKEYFINFIISASKDDKSAAVKALNVLQNQDLRELKVGYYSAVQDIVESWTGFKNTDDSEIDKAVDLLEDNVMNLLKYSQEEWFINSFGSDYNFRTGMLGLYQMIKGM